MNSLLIGKNANNLRALQHIVMMTLVARNAEVTRVNIDVADYKRQRADKIERQAEQWIQDVRKTGREKILDLNAAYILCVKTSLTKTSFTYIKPAIKGRFFVPEHHITPVKPNMFGCGNGKLLRNFLTHCAKLHFSTPHK